MDCSKIIKTKLFSANSLWYDCEREESVQCTPKLYFVIFRVRNLYDLNILLEEVIELNIVVLDSMLISLIILLHIHRYYKGTLKNVGHQY